MKYFLYASFLTALIFSACKKDNETEPQTNPTPNTLQPLVVEKKNRAALIYFGEDWCAPCGSYGGPTLDSCLKDEGTLLTGFKIARTSNNSNLNWTTGSAAMRSEFVSGVFQGSSGIPALAVNNTKQPITSSVSSNTTSSRQKAQTIANAPVAAGLALRQTIEGDSIIVETKAKFFNSITAGSDYRLALYVVEDEVVAGQTVNGGSVGNYIHRNLVRTTNASVYTGVSINNSTAISAEEEFDKMFKIYLKPSWNKTKLKVVGIIWKMGTTPATVINSNYCK